MDFCTGGAVPLLASELGWTCVFCFCQLVEKSPSLLAGLLPPSARVLGSEGPRPGLRQSPVRREGREEREALESQLRADGTDWHSRSAYHEVPTEPSEKQACLPGLLRCPVAMAMPQCSTRNRWLLKGSGWHLVECVSRWGEGIFPEGFSEWAQGLGFSPGVAGLSLPTPSCQSGSSSHS